MPLTPIDLPPGAEDIFDRGQKYALENGNILAYGLTGVESSTVQETCDQATDSYAREILYWPNGRLAKPEIFSPVQGTFEDLDSCAVHFVQYMADVFASAPPKQIPVYPHAFVVISGDADATAVIAHQRQGKWLLSQKLLAVRTELGQTLDSLRMGDLNESVVLG